jgi:hypothetical protein
VSYYAVYGCPVHSDRAEPAPFGPPTPPYCGWSPEGEWPCTERLVITRWRYDPTEADPKPERVWAIGHWMLGVLGIWCVIAFGALCIFAATRGR